MRNEEISKIEQLISETPGFNRPLFLISEKKMLRVTQNSPDVIVTREDLGIVRTLRLERGDILDVLCKLEFFIGRIIAARFFGLTSKRAEEFSDCLGRMNLQSKIILLKKWNEINNQNLFDNIKTARNNIAHAWSLKEVLYKGIPIESNFDTFKEDLEKAFRELICAYREIEKKKGFSVEKIEKICRELKNQRRTAQ